MNGQTGKNDGVYANFYVYGNHLGDSLQKAILTAQNRDIYNPEIVEAERLDTNEEFELPVDCLEIEDNVVFMKEAIHLYPLNDPYEHFIPPIGIVKSTEDSNIDYDSIQEKFIIFSRINIRKPTQLYH